MDSHTEPCNFWVRTLCSTNHFVFPLRNIVGITRFYERELSRDKAMNARHAIQIHVGVYSKDDTMAHTRRLVVTS